MRVPRTYGPFARRVLGIDTVNVRIRIPSFGHSLMITTRRFGINGLRIIFGSVTGRFLRSESVTTERSMLISPTIMNPTLLSHSTVGRYRTIINRMTNGIFGMRTRVFLTSIFRRPREGSMIPLPVTRFAVIRRRSLNRILRIFFFGHILRWPVLFLTRHSTNGFRPMFTDDHRRRNAPTTTGVGRHLA